MTVAFLMVALGTALVYGGWTNRSVWAVARGDNTVVKPVEKLTAAGITTTSPAA